jgi:hypothetical protein
VRQSVSVFRTATNADCGISTLPTIFMRFLPFLLLLEQLAFAGDVAAVALGGDVLALGLDRLAGDDLAADRRLDRHVEHLARDQVSLSFSHMRAPVLVGLVAVHDRRERVHRADR